MLKRFNRIAGRKLEATDGTNIGEIADALIDDDRWTVRYLVVDPRGWLDVQRTLISPFSVVPPIGDEGRIQLRLTREQVRTSPPLESGDITRKYEAEYSAHYGIPSYWIGGGLWGQASMPATLAPVPRPRATPADARLAREAAESRLKSAGVIKGFHIEASDGEIGHVDDFFLDEETWAVRYLQIDTSNWIGGKPVVVSPAWAAGVRWLEGSIRFDLTREQIANSPELKAGQPITGEFERHLEQHFGRSPAVSR